MDLSDYRRSGRWNSAIMEAAVLERGLGVTRRGPFRFLASDGVDWIHTFDPTAPRTPTARARFKNKQWQRERLAAAGIPVPEGRAFGPGGRAAAMRYAKGLHHVAVKPLSRSKGIGVSLPSTGDYALHEAIEAARLIERTIIVEQRVFGRDYRILATSDGVLAAVERTPPSVVGDGRSTVAELVAAKNAGRVAPAAEQIAPPPAAVAAQVPAAGDVILLSEVCNVSQGGDSRDATGELEPRLADLAVRAVRAIGLSHGGVDIVGEHVIEVNYSPSLRVHLHPGSGEVRRVDRMLVERYHGGVG